MKKYLFFILVFGFLFFSLPVFAIHTYTRTPTGYNIWNPVILFVEFPTYPCGSQKWRLTIQPNNYSHPVVFSSWVSVGDRSETFVINLPFDTYQEIQAKCEYGSVIGTMEANPPPVGIFVVGIEPPKIFGTYSSFNTAFASSVFGFGEQFISDLGVALYILIGLTLGMGIIIFILDLFEKRKEK
jgi:hypothetical protein